MNRLIIFLFFITTTFSSAQLFDGLDDILTASTGDAQLLANAYIEPLGQSLTYSLNAGWASSAKTHKKLGFDLTIGVTLPSVSDDSKKFAIAGLGLANLESTPITANTIFGGNSKTTFTEKTTGATFDLPGGLEDDLVMNSLPVPYIQAGLGLFFDTDVIVRYVPKVKNQGAEFGLVGVGLKHSLTQYLGLVDKLPLNVSVLGSYSKLNVDYNLNNASPGQKVTYDVDTFLVQALASLDLPVISLVGGIGYGKGDASMQMLGTYEVPLPSGLPSKTLTDPLKSENSFTGAHALVGLRLNLLFLKLFANYTLQEFNTLNVGASINFR